MPLQDLSGKVAHPVDALNRWLCSEMVPDLQNCCKTTSDCPLSTPPGKAAALSLSAGVGALLLVGCAASDHLYEAPPSPSKPWQPPALLQYSAMLAETSRAGPAAEPGQARASYAGEAVPIDPQKTYTLAELIDIAQRTNPETRIAWEQARQAAIAIGLAESTYYPWRVLSAAAGHEYISFYIPQSLIPQGHYVVNVSQLIPALSLQWLLFDLGGRRAAVDAAQEQLLAANAGFNGQHQQIVFAVMRSFYALSAARAQVDVAHAALESAQIIELAVVERQEQGLATRPELLQAHQQTAQAAFELEAARGAESKAQATLAASMGIRANTPLRVVDLSKQPLPPALEESADQLIGRALGQRPDLLALFATVRAKEAEIRKARAAYLPKILMHARGSQLIADVSISHQPYFGENEPQYSVGIALEWPLFDGYERGVVL